MELHRRDVPPATSVAANEPFSLAAELPKPLDCVVHCLRCTGVLRQLVFGVGHGFVDDRYVIGVHVLTFVDAHLVSADTANTVSV